MKHLTVFDLMKVRNSEHNIDFVTELGEKILEKLSGDYRSRIVDVIEEAASDIVEELSENDLIESFDPNEYSEASSIAFDIANSVLAEIIDDSGYSTS